MHLGNIRQMHSPLVKPLLTRKCFLYKKNTQRFKSEKICKIIDSTNDFNRLKITYAFQTCSKVVLFALASVVVCFVYSLAWATVLAGGTFTRTLEITKKTKKKTSKPYLCRCLKLIFFGSQVQGTPVNVKIQNKAVRIDFLIIFQFTIRKLWKITFP